MKSGQQTTTGGMFFQCNMKSGISPGKNNVKKPPWNAIEWRLISRAQKTPG